MSIDIFTPYERNLIINGDFRVGQRGTSFISTTTPDNGDDTYLFDRWILLSDGDDIVDVTQGTDGAVGNETYLQADIETVSLKFGFLQIIENKDIYALLSEAESVSLSFNALVSNATKLSRIKAMILSWTSTADAPTSDFVSAWGIEGTSPTAVANWTIEGDSGDLGVTATDVRYVLENVSIDASGVTNIAVFIWSDDVATNDTLGSLLKITNVSLVPGAAARDFEYRPFAEELALCQRYYQKTFPQGTAPAQNAGFTGGFLFSQIQGASAAESPPGQRFHTIMRAAPAITFYNPGAANAQIRNSSIGADWTGVNASQIGDAGFTIGGTTDSGSASGNTNGIHWSADAEL